MPSEDIDLVTDIRSPVMAQSPRGGRAILWAVLILSAIAIFWASVSEVEEVTRGQGKVVPASQIQVIQNLEGGILSEILVNVGDTVKKDQLLLKIDQTRFSSSVQQNQAKHLSNKAKAARLQAETSGSPFSVPREVMAEQPEIGIREQELYESRKKELQFSLEIKQQQYNQRNHELRELNSKLAELNKTFLLFQEELKLTKPLVAKGAVSEMEVLRLERQASEMQGEIEQTKQAIPRAQSRIEESQVALKELRLAFINKAKSELNEVLAQLGEDSATSIALQDRLDRTFVKSPVNGTVNRLHINTVGGVIQPGMNLIEIVPLEGTLLVEAMIKPSDIAFLRPNQDAMVKFTAYDFTIFGGLTAKLEQISADSITDEKGNSFYLVRLRTDKSYLGPQTNPLPIIPGMIASVDILTGKKTVLSYLLKPVLRAKYMALRER
ncbi:MAG: HlyD family type I secretion periplasmic adaptor subunit [Proteobacteria bacterium]|nr:HlyD family type I secretion periplasmic adaptor subunit [Pseudomonadota bacterium]MBU1398676.1 HlyD family type I secretion periplasmic adaptor subunit [Pseudomonadota bacterium]